MPCLTVSFSRQGADLAAVGAEDRAVDVTVRGTGEEGHDLGDLAWLTRPASGIDPIQYGDLIPEQGGGAFGLHQTGRDGVDPHPTAEPPTQLALAKRVNLDRLERAQHRLAVAERRLLADLDEDDTRQLRLPLTRVARTAQREAPAPEADC